MPRFSGAIYKIGINPVIDPPEDVMESVFAQAGMSKGPIPVRGEMNGTEFIQTLVKFRGAWRLYVNGPMLKNSGLVVGDHADVEIEFDPRARDVPIPTALAEALENDTPAAKAFYALSPSRRKEIFRYISSLKSTDAVAKNVERILRHLHGEKIDHVLTRQRRR